MRRILSLLSVLLIWPAVAMAQAESDALPTKLPTTVDGLLVEMDRVSFDLPKEGDARVNRLAELVMQSELLAKSNSNDAGFLMMAGFLNAQYAGAKGGIGALKNAKAARDYLKASVAIDPNYYQAAAHAVLGSLYAQVPGWPVGFGNKKKAEQNFKEALKQAPNGMDANFTYAQYLFYDKKKYESAKVYYLRAQHALSIPNRAEAIADLQQHISTQLSKIEKILAN